MKDCNIHDLKLSTPSFRRLLSLAELERQHSNDLFYTIQAGNPQTAKVRRQFINKAVKLNRTISLHESWLKRLKRSLELRRA